jgi:uncharacterized Rmd1/YagE family protein
MASLYAPGSVVTVRALLLGERIDLKGLEAAQRLASNPLLISAGEGQQAALFRYGAVVLFGLSPLQEVTFLNQLAPLVGQAYAKRETEDARIRVDPASEEQIAGGEIVLREVTLERLQNKRALRVEWYIVALIVFEILLTLYQLLFLGSH